VTWRIALPRRRGPNSAAFGLNVAAADGVIDAITERFWLLAQYPRMGRSRDDLRPGLRSFTVGEYVIFYIIEHEDVEILRVLHGRQDIEGQLGR
jgi:toxin ParE1/3/4